MTGATFLLVDDDDRLRERLGRALVERGHVVHLAADHAAALEVARARNTPRPMPRPGCLVVKTGSPTRATTSASIPGPRSITSTSARAARVRRWTATVAPAGLASRAFWISATTDCAR